MTGTLRFKSAILANLLPSNEDLSFDDVNYRTHLSWLANRDGVDAIVCDGHVGEVSSLDREERRRALAIAADAVGDQVEVIPRIYWRRPSLLRTPRRRARRASWSSPRTLFMWGAGPSLPLSTSTPSPRPPTCRSSSSSIRRPSASTTIPRRRHG